MIKEKLSGKMKNSLKIEIKGHNERTKEILKTIHKQTILRYELINNRHLESGSSIPKL